MERKNKHTILICDDCEAIHESLGCFLREENMSVISVFDGKSALEEVREGLADLLILDVMLPDISGMDICRAIREISDIPILFLSSRSGETDRVLGLELGGDDYVTKPFSPREVAIRVKRILQRKSPAGSEDIPAKNEHTCFENLTVDTRVMEVRIDGEKIEMTAKEVHLLAYLAENARRVLNREQILDAVWGYDYFGDTRAVDAAIKRIRKKIAPCRACFEIQTIYSAGYRLAKKEKIPDTHE